MFFLLFPQIEKTPYC